MSWTTGIPSSYEDPQNSSNETICEQNVTENCPNREMYVPYYERPETYIVPIVFFFILVIGVSGNGVLVLTILRHAKMRNVPNTYVLSLALGDLLVIVICVPFTATIYTIESWPFGLAMCKISEYAKDISIGVSVFTLTALSADRFFAIVDPMRKLHATGGGKRATRLTSIIAGLIWLMAIGFAVPASFSYIRVEPVNKDHTIQDYPFVIYRNDHRNVRISNGELVIQPTLVESELGKNFILSGNLSLQRCTGEQQSIECQRKAYGPYILPPVFSGLIDSKDAFVFTYGRVEIRAKFPHGDWIYPVLNLETSVENPRRLRLIMATSNGNVILNLRHNEEYSGRILGSGPIGELSSSPVIIYKVKQLDEPWGKMWSDDYHVYEFEWRKSRVSLRIDDKKFNEIEMSDSFDKPFFLRLGVDVGGITHFPDYLVSEMFDDDDLRRFSTNELKREKYTLAKRIGAYTKPWRNAGAQFCYPFPDEYGKSYQRWIVVIRFFIYYFIPLLIIGIFYLLMARHLVQSTKRIPGEMQGQEKQVKARKKVACMVLTFVAVFAICFLPQHVYMLWFYFHPTAETDFNGYWHFFRILGFCLAFMNSCINPIALYFVSGSFRTYFNRYLLCCCVMKKNRSRLSIESHRRGQSFSLSTRRNTNSTRYRPTQSNRQSFNNFTKIVDTCVDGYEGKYHQSSVERKSNQHQQEQETMITLFHDCPEQSL